MQFNLLVHLTAALIPLIIGFIWYNPKVLGTLWMKESGMTTEKIGKPNPLIFLWCYLASFLIALMLTPMVIHQFGFYSVLYGEPGFEEPTSELGKYISDFMVNYGNNFRTFKHGVLHGTINALLLITPVIGINAMFEKKSFKYVMIHAGYWVLCLAIMGGIICQFS
ncbi:DUF1761 domain-containing protein [Wenyingzhuangia aestuarii]|uniref:DUF1761 domain-containing protein n=1 Tax=Wenyingzhuangia aestuarii TaxID=1647582 RepID=UPI001439D1B7|nr:DUF1761 domain-containing protein [Wenyingzhuangia aestuarii]NJB83720.1 hypothetical protein [Wenyingzhuangia aestuarii]